MYKKVVKILQALFIIVSVSSEAQVNQKSFYQLSGYINKTYSKKIQSNINNFNNFRNLESSKNTLSINSGNTIAQIFEKYESFISFQKKYKFTQRKSIDTLIVGAYGNDSLIITGTYFHNGPIMVVNNGKLRFKNANATIIGDIYVWGADAKLLIDSSYIYCPQQYFYQRTLLAAISAKVIINNSTLDFSGLSHNLALADSSMAIFNNVTNLGFTTCGSWGKPTVRINGTNQAGEFIASGKSVFDFKNAETLLIWHHIPSGGSIDFSFPAGANLNNYQFNSSTSGVSGIGYNIKADSCTDVMWGLMPTNGSTTKISNSVLRTIGLWFEGNDTVNVSGLVNNSTYTDFIANLTDRNLRLINSSVTTWSLYPMKKSHVEATGCIVGEIGSQGRSRTEVSNIVIDGSGGYVFSTDTTITIIGYSSSSCAIRSDKNGILIFAYSSLMNGIANSLGYSVMVIIQSLLQEEPTPLDNSCMWFETINSPSTGYVDSLINIKGSAWIDKTSSSPLMDFNYYYIDYQKANDSVWIPITPKIYCEKRSETLALWNTNGIAPGNYTMRLTLADNSSPDTNKFEAVKAISLLPKVLNVEDYIIDEPINVFPNPAKDKINIFMPYKNDLKLYNSHFQLVYSIIDTKENTVIDVSSFPKGIYLLKVGERFIKKILVL